jgi:hypothetical protein
VYLPSMFGPLGGLVADRADRKRLLVRISVVSAVADLPLLAVYGPAWVWIIYLVMAWYGTQLVLSGPAEDALFVQLFSPEQRQGLNGWRLGLQESGRLVAPLVGAGLFTLAGGGAVALLDAATFVIAAAATARLRVGGDARPKHEKIHWRADLLAGYAHVRGNHALAAVLAVGAALMAVSALVVAAQYSLVGGIGQSPPFLGVLSACLGGGSVAASLVSGRVLRGVGEGWLAVFGTLNFAAGTALESTGVLGCVVAGTVVLGFALPWIYLAVLNLAQRLTPEQLQGRVSATVTLAMFGPQAPLQALGSLAIRYATFREIYISAAAAALACASYLVRQVLRHRQAYASRRECRTYQPHAP